MGDWSANRSPLVPASKAGYQDTVLQVPVGSAMVPYTITMSP